MSPLRNQFQKPKVPGTGLPVDALDGAVGRTPPQISHGIGGKALSPLPVDRSVHGGPTRSVVAPGGGIGSLLGAGPNPITHGHGGDPLMSVLKKRIR